MNVKPGDLALCILAGEYYGLLFSVIEAAPVGVPFRLPNGVNHQPVGANYWIVESLGREVPTRLWL